jgi:hypothetical protein
MVPRYPHPGLTLTALPLGEGVGVRGKSTSNLNSKCFC